MPEFNRFPSKARPRITAVRLRKNFQKRPIGNVTVCNRKSPSLITAIFTFEICFSLLISSFTLPFIRERIFIMVLFFIIRYVTFQSPILSVFFDNSKAVSYLSMPPSVISARALKIHANGRGADPPYSSIP